MAKYPCFIDPCDVVPGSKADEWITVAAPATTANVGIGFDCLGFALEDIQDISQNPPKDHPTFLGDIIHLRIGKGPEPIKILGVYREGKEHPDIPRSIYENVVGRVAEGVARKQMSWKGNTPPLEIILEKMRFAGSGMGSSAASVVSTAYATHLASTHDDKRKIAETVVRCEVGQHPDNVLPALFGGFVHIISMNKPSDVKLSEELMALREAGNLLELSSMDQAISRMDSMHVPAIEQIIAQYRAVDFQKPREASRQGEVLRIYNDLLAGLKEKVSFTMSKGISNSILYLLANPDEPLLGSIEHIRTYKDMQSAEKLLCWIERRERNRLSRMHNTAHAEREYLSKLIDGKLRQYIINHRDADLALRHEQLEIHETIQKDMYVLIIKPDVYISTVEARRLIKLADGQKTNDDILTHTSMGIFLVNSLKNGDIRGVGEAINNDRISEPVRGKLIPHYFQLKQKMTGPYGLYGLNISGSGSACFGITDNKDMAIAKGREAINFYDARNIGCEAFLCKVDTMGAKRLYR